mmetsp:Transcript_29909/g.26461  ORF Transcript_29909/g.26461 Transcript_29909/m.26461 type:complete len:85 (+) Transcript_29909:997-1251(+)
MLKKFDLRNETKSNLPGVIFDKTLLSKKNKKVVEQINSLHRRLVSFEDPGADTISGEIKIFEESNQNFPRNKSFKTTFSSTVEL